jgi:hypothetical protein
MPNRTIEVSFLIREMVKNYIDSARSPSLSGAVEFVNAKCEEQDIIPPVSITISKLLKENGVSATRWTWGKVQTP